MKTKNVKINWLKYTAWLASLAGFALAALSAMAGPANDHRTPEHPGYVIGSTNP